MDGTSSGNDTRLRPGTRVRLQDDGEGWFSGAAPDVVGVVEGDLGKGDYPTRWYVVRLDEPLEVQESGHDTPSGFVLMRYSLVLIRCRWMSVEISRGKFVSVFVCVVPDGRDPAQHLASVTEPDAWASGTVID